MRCDVCDLEQVLPESAVADGSRGKIVHALKSHCGYYAARSREGKRDATSLQRECSARARSGNSIDASRPFREMIARPKIIRNEWKTAEI